MAEIEDIRLHDLRHSFASIAVSDDAGFPIIGALLGHTNSATTQRYAHLHDDLLKAASEAVGIHLAATMGEIHYKNDTNDGNQASSPVATLDPVVQMPPSKQLIFADLTTSTVSATAWILLSMATWLPILLAYRRLGNPAWVIDSDPDEGARPRLSDPWSAVMMLDEYAPHRRKAVEA